MPARDWVSKTRDRSVEQKQAPSSASYGVRCKRQRRLGIAYGALSAKANNRHSVRSIVPVKCCVLFTKDLGQRKEPML